MDPALGGWDLSAKAWIKGQGELGDVSRRGILDPCLDLLFSDVAGQSVLDVGCGEGRYARKLAARGAVVTGIDPVQEFVDVAQRRLPSGTFIKAFGESLPLPDSSFDFVLSYLSIIDIPDYVSAIKEMSRVLKPGGKIVVATVSNVASTTDNWVKDASGARLYRTVDRYMEEFAMDLAWDGLQIVNFHRPLSHILGVFFERGLVMDRFIEPLPSAGDPMYVDEFRVPTFQVMTFRSAPTQWNRASQRG